MLVRVTQLVLTDELDHDDQHDLPAGEHGKDSVHEYRVPDGCIGEEEALDWFHDHVPIHCLDHFDILVIFHEGDVVEVYSRYEISAAPAHQREFRFNFAHKEYMGPDDPRCGFAKSIAGCKERIDEINAELLGYEDSCETCGSATESPTILCSACEGMAETDHV